MPPSLSDESCSSPSPSSPELPPLLDPGSMLGSLSVAQRSKEAFNLHNKQETMSIVKQRLITMLYNNFMREEVFSILHTRKHTLVCSYHKWLDFKFGFLNIFAVGESGMRGLASYKAKSWANVQNCLQREIAISALCSSVARRVPSYPGCS